MPGMYLLAVRIPLDSDPRGPTETLLESRVPKPVLGQAEEEKVRLHGLLASVLHSICCRSGGSLYSTMQTSKVIRLHGRLVFPWLDYPFAKSRETGLSECGFFWCKRVYNPTDVSQHRSDSK